MSEMESYFDALIGKHLEVLVSERNGEIELYSPTLGPLLEAITAIKSSWWRPGCDALYEPRRNSGRKGHGSRHED